MTAVARLLNWAAKEDLIERNPLQNKFEKPPAGNREQLISPEEYQAILKHVTGGFRDLIVTAWETGCRPQEVTRVEARHVELTGSRWIFPVKESKGKKRQRIVYLTDGALEITKRLMRENPEGPLFRNRNGDPWTSYAVNCNFLRLQSTMGRDGVEIQIAEIEAQMRKIEKSRKAKGKPPLKETDLRFQAKKCLVDAAARKNAPKYCLYAFRHSYCTNGLKNGTDPVTMGKLMGHTDLTMIYKIYNHIAQDPAFMLAAAQKVVK
ncbi:MAG: tyrosine-type recombinase/integrase [Planctomycetota bacterium]|nr:tyrosine-type recombinase/integrase [Planctomycetota bacterium]